ncbi:MAG: hypothetical protein KAT05_07860 [Spirochaetes bacterium]|nr:hypothetical protein [Spirochaetota bacterium]
MLYSTMKKNIDLMIEDIAAGKEECRKIISFNLIKDQNIPITINAKLIYPLDQIKFTLFCPFLLVYPEIKFVEIYKQNVEEDYVKLLKLISKFSTLLDMLKNWVEKEAPDLIRWGEGVIFDKNGKTTKIPLSLFHK